MYIHWCYRPAKLVIIFDKNTICIDFFAANQIKK